MGQDLGPGGGRWQRRSPHPLPSLWRDLDERWGSRHKDQPVRWLRGVCCCWPGGRRGLARALQPRPGKSVGAAGKCLRESFTRSARVLAPSSSTETKLLAILIVKHRLTPTAA